MESELIKKSKEYAESVLKKTPAQYSYHCSGHTLQVVNAAEEIGEESGLSQNDLESVIIAAWFHDTGFSEGFEDHEARAAARAEELLRNWKAPEEKIASVKHAILATKMPQNPGNLIDKVLCDADLYHLSTYDAEEGGARLRKEIALIKKIEFTDEEWINHNLQFFANHHYFTTYGQTVLQHRKDKIVKKLKKKASHLMHEDHLEKIEEQIRDLEKKTGKKSDKKSKPERGIESMFRIVSQNHTTLSAMADNKSNIMISINSIILSVVVTILFRKLEDFPNLLWPTLLLVTVCLVTIVFAVLASRPHISSGTFTEEDIKNKKTNLLFFGNFHGMGLKNYEWGMKEMMKDSDYLYSSLIKDIYFNGKVLAKKYQMLRISYTIFMFGFVASIIAFIVAMLIYYYPTGSLSL